MSTSSDDDLPLRVRYRNLNLTANEGNKPPAQDTDGDGDSTTDDELDPVFRDAMVDEVCSHSPVGSDGDDDVDQAEITEELYIVEKVVEQRRGPDGDPEYRLRWEGYDADKDTWQKASTFGAEVLSEWHKVQAGLPPTFSPCTDGDGVVVSILDEAVRDGRTVMLCVLENVECPLWVPASSITTEIHAQWVRDRDRKLITQEPSPEWVQFEDPIREYPAAKAAGGQAWLDFCNTRLHMKPSDWKALEPDPVGDGWATDSIIDSVHLMLHCEFKTQFISALGLSKRICRRLYQNVPTVVTHHTTKGHWVWSCRVKKHIMACDSLANYINLHVREQMSRIYVERAKDLKFLIVPTPRQSLGDVCGHRCLALSTEVSMRGSMTAEDIRRLHFDDSKLRAHTLEILKTGRITAYPKLPPLVFRNPLRARLQGRYSRR